MVFDEVERVWMEGWKLVTSLVEKRPDWERVEAWERRDREVERLD